MEHTVPQQPAPDWEAARRLIGTGRLSIIMPAHDLGATIESNIAHVRNLFQDHFAVEIVAVDDGSSDQTRSAIESAAHRFPGVKPVILPHNMGKGEALKRGFAESSGNFVLLLDGDLDLPPEQVSHFFELMEQKQADVVIGCKLHPKSRISAYPWHRRLASRIYYTLVKVMVGLPVHDTQTGLKLFKRRVLEVTMPRMLVKRFAFDLELLAVAHRFGFRISEAPVSLRLQGTWQFLPFTAVRQIMHDTLAIFYRLRFVHYYDSDEICHAGGTKEPPPHGNRAP